VRALGAPLVFLGLSGLYLATSMTFPVGSAARPGAGFFPAAVGLYLCVLGLAAVIAAWSRGAAASIPAAPVPADARARVATLMAALVGFCLTLGWIGYPAAAFLFVAVVLRRVGRASWRGALVIGLAAAAASYYLFGILLGVPLPRGTLLG
jgi:putative tricarboxylic transport membrane protein